jgi:Bacterial TniB protein
MFAVIGQKRPLRHAKGIRSFECFCRPSWGSYVGGCIRKNLLDGHRLADTDEAHRLLAGSYREQRRALNLLKGLTNELMIPVIAVETEDALHAIQTDTQVASRFDPLHLARWGKSDAFRNFIVTFGK